jgi:hypothetical protein
VTASGELRASATAEWLGAAAASELGLGKLEAVEDKRWEDEEGRVTHSVWREENETDKWITEEAKPRIGRRFWSSIGEQFYTFFGSWRPRIGMRYHIGVLLELALRLQMLT